MRIDYNVPKQSYSSGANRSTPRKDSGTGSTLLIIAITGAIMFAAGFGAGWFFSQKAAKASYQKAMEQSSLENSPPAPPKQQAQAPTPAPLQPQPQQPAQATQSAGQPTSPASTPQSPTTAPEPPLSFYKTLPSGQKSSVIGSGINTGKEDKAKQPLQAPIPSNVSKPQTPAPTEQARPADKGTQKQDSGGLTVQVASYSLKSEAEAHRQKLAAKGYNAFISETNLGDKGVWYRVRVGKKLEPDAAKELAAKLGKGALPTPDKD